MNWEIAQEGKEYTDYKIVFESIGDYYDKRIIKAFSRLKGKNIIKRKPIHLRKPMQWISIPYQGVRSD